MEDNISIVELLRKEKPMFHLESATQDMVNVEDFLFKKDASKRNSELIFYEYLQDKPDLMKKFVKIYGTVTVSGEELREAIKECTFKDDFVDT